MVTKLWVNGLMVWNDHGDSSSNLDFSDYDHQMSMDHIKRHGESLLSAYVGRYLCYLLLYNNFVPVWIFLPIKSSVSETHLSIPSNCSCARRWELAETDSDEVSLDGVLLFTPLFLIFWH